MQVSEGTLTSRCSRSDANMSLFSVTLACMQLDSSTANWMPSAGVAVHTAVCARRAAPWQRTVSSAVSNNDRCGSEYGAGGELR
jgi:hypothetical protein